MNLHAGSSLAVGAGSQSDAILSITPAGDGLRARRVVTRSGARWRGKYPSWKMGRMLQWESPHELNAFRLLDADPSVLRFSEQPCVIRYRRYGIDHTHYPDLLIERAHRAAELWEIKTARDAASADVMARTRFMRAALPAMGYGYQVVLGEDLGRQPRLDACLTLLRFGKRAVDLVSRERAREALGARGHICWGESARTCLGNDGPHVLARLALEGVLTVDLESGIADGTAFFAATTAVARNCAAC